MITNQKARRQPALHGYLDHAHLECYIAERGKRIMQKA